MAKIHGKPNEEEFTKITIDNITEEQIVAMAKYIQLLQEESKNLKGYVIQLQAQLQKARGDRAVAQHNLNVQNAKFVQTETMIKTAFDEES